MLTLSLKSSTPEESRPNGLNPSLNTSHTLVKPMLPMTRKSASHQTLFKIHEKRKSIANRSDGPLKKRGFFKTDTPTPVENNRINSLACKKNIDQMVAPIKRLDGIKNFHSAITTPFTLGSYQVYSPLVSHAKLQSRANDSTIKESLVYHLPQSYTAHQNKNLKSRQDIKPLLPTSPKNTNSSKDLHTLLKNDADGQQFIGIEATQDKFDSTNHDALNLLENDFSSLYRGLSLNQDKDNLSELQCFIRENIEIVTATEQDENTYFRGRNWTVEIGQVGLRCKHCYKTLRTKDKLPKSSRYFPLTLSGVYQAAQNIYHFHFKNGLCPNMPQNVLLELNSTKSSRSCYGGGKQYWIIAAESLGLIESQSGLWLKDSAHPTSSKQESASRTTDESYIDILLNDASLDETSLVIPDDRNLVTDYIFMLMCQMKQYPTKNEDEKNITIPGLILCCKHCMGNNGKGIFNRTKVTSISKNEFFYQVNNHLDRCSLCPNPLKEVANHLKEIHDVQKRKLKRGSRKEFFNRILNRLKSSE